MSDTVKLNLDDEIKKRKEEGEVKTKKQKINVFFIVLAALVVGIGTTLLIQKSFFGADKVSENDRGLKLEGEDPFDAGEDLRITPATPSMTPDIQALITDAVAKATAEVNEIEAEKQEKLRSELEELKNSLKNDEPEPFRIKAGNDSRLFAHEFLMIHEYDDSLGTYVLRPDRPVRALGNDAPVPEKLQISKASPGYKPEWESYRCIKHPTRLTQSGKKYLIMVPPSAMQGS